MRKLSIFPLMLTIGLALGTTAGAATVSLAPSSPTVATNSAFTVDLSLNAADAPGSHPGLYLGQIVIDFSPAQLSYQGFAVTSPVSLLSGPTVGSAAGRTTVTLEFSNATDLSKIGSFSFLALGAPDTQATIGLADADNFFGTFISKLPTDQPFAPAFSGTSVTMVPLPATAWLLASGLGVLGIRRRTEHQPRR